MCYTHPGFIQQVIQDARDYFQDAKIEGIFMEHSSECGESYLMDQLEFYVTLKLADDPGLDGSRLIDEFFERYYGTASGPMKELYCLIEQTFSSPKSYPPEIQRSVAHQHQTKELAWKWLATKERLGRFATLMAQARQAAKTPAERARVAAFEQGQWEYLCAGQKSEEKAAQGR